MDIKTRAMGYQETNCYVIHDQGECIIIDPGVDSLEWLKQNAEKSLAILNTHCHFDHTWGNNAAVKFFNCPLYVPVQDAFMCQKDIFQMGMPLSKPDYLVKANETIQIGHFTLQFHHYPGHCPGCSMIQIGEHIFSGDFIFKNSIGRYDFPYSDPRQMLDSLERFAKSDIKGTFYPGHGPGGDIEEEKANSSFWIEILRKETTQS